VAEFPGGMTAEHAFAEHEHRELARGIDRIHEVAGCVGTVAGPDLSIALLDVLDWVEVVLEPHAAWEDAWLYPEIDRRAGTAWATRLMTFEHRQIREIGRRLEADRELLDGEPGRERALELVAHLFALEALLRAHIEREERFLMPILDREASAPILAAGRGAVAS
jgi:iron-sulfur cluster repair protein YtfE (RIC family)